MKTLTTILLTLAALTVCSVALAANPKPPASSPLDSGTTFGGQLGQLCSVIPGQGCLGDFQLDARLLLPPHAQTLDMPMFVLHIQSDSECDSTQPSCPAMKSAFNRKVILRIDGRPVKILRIHWRSTGTPDVSLPYRGSSTLLDQMKERISDPIPFQPICGWHRYTFTIAGDAYQGGPWAPFTQNAVSPAIWLNGSYACIS